MNFRLSNILEAPAAGVKGNRLVLATGTHYVPFAVDGFSAENGYHLLLIGAKGGTGDVEISVEQAVSPEQTTWVEILAAANFGTDQAGVVDAQLVRTLGIPATAIYQPHGRLKIIVPVNCVALFTKVLRTGGY